MSLQRLYLKMLDRRGPRGGSYGGATAVCFQPVHTSRLAFLPASERVRTVRGQVEAMVTESCKLAFGNMGGGW